MNPPKNTASRIVALAFCIATAFAFRPIAAAPADGLANVKTQADLDGVVASTADPALKAALRDSAPAILAAVEQRPHVDAVVQTVLSSPGRFEKINATPESLKRAVGGDVPLFDTLKVVNLSIPNAGPHDARKIDPYDATFFEHLGHLSALESLNVIQTKAADDWIAPLGKLVNLRSLTFTNNGPLTDAGLEHLAGLRQLESFSFVGTGMRGHAFAKFDGWTHLKHASFRGSSIDDEGLSQLCAHLSNLESISLAHAKFTDVGAASLANLTKLRSLEIGTHNATPRALQYVVKLPLENLQLGEGFNGAESITSIKDIPTLRRLTLTDARTITDADLRLLSGMSQLESLELDDAELPDDRLPQLKALSFLKSCRLVRRPQAYPPGTQAKIKALLPNVALKFD